MLTFLDSESAPAKRDDYVVTGALLFVHEPWARCPRTNRAKGYCHNSRAVAAPNRSREAKVLQAAASFETRWTSLIRPVSTSKIKPRTGTSLAIHGCDLTFFICSRVFSSGSLKEKRRIGAGDASPVRAVSFAFSSSSVNVVNPQPVRLRSMISFDP